MSINTVSILLAMREYQKMNTISKMCVTNAQYLYDCIKNNTDWDVKAEAVLVTSMDKTKNTLICSGGHIVLSYFDENGEKQIIEPSYEFHSLKNKKYYDNIGMFLSKFDETLKKSLRQCVSNFIDFKNVADKINNGELCISDESYYNKQANYVEENFQRHKNYVVNQCSKIKIKHME